MLINTCNTRSFNNFFNREEADKYFNAGIAGIAVKNPKHKNENCNNDIQTPGTMGPQPERKAYDCKKSRSQTVEPISRVGSGD